MAVENGLEVVEMILVVEENRQVAVGRIPAVEENG